MIIDSHQRSILKSISWRVISLVVLFFVSLGVTRSPKVAISISVIDTILKIGLYYIHERTWTNIRWGKRKKMPK